MLERTRFWGYRRDLNARPSSASSTLFRCHGNPAVASKAVTWRCMARMPLRSLPPRSGTNSTSIHTSVVPILRGFADQLCSNNPGFRSPTLTLPISCGSLETRGLSPRDIFLLGILQASNLSTQEAEAEGSQVRRDPEQFSEIVPQIGKPVISPRLRTTAWDGLGCGSILWFKITSYTDCLQRGRSRRGPLGISVIGNYLLPPPPRVPHHSDPTDFPVVIYSSLRSICADLLQVPLLGNALKTVITALWVQDCFRHVIPAGRCF